MINTEEVKIGQVVRLASGGPAMTIDEVRDDGFITVAWFDGAEVRRDAFTREQLEAA